MKLIIALFILFLPKFCFSQNTIPKVLERLNRNTVPYITVYELRSKDNYILIDSREPVEFNVSHLKNAINVGFSKFDKNIFNIVTDKNSTIIVYCSIGVRSEKIGQKFLKMGYKNVYNLYGGIFEWKNDDGKVVDKDGLETENVHTYNKKWSKYLKNGIKIY